MVVDDVANGSEAERTQAARADVQRFRDVTLDILRRSTCLDIIPDSGKVVVFDSELPIKHAFFGLVEHGWPHSGSWLGAADDVHALWMQISSAPPCGIPGRATILA